MVTKKPETTPESRDALEATIREAREKLAAVQVVENTEQQAEAAARRDRTFAVYQARTDAGIDLESAAIADRDAAWATLVDAFASSPLGAALADYIAADANVGHVRRELDQAFVQLHPDWPRPVSDPVPPVPQSATALLAAVVGDLAAGRLEATSATRRAAAADYVEGRTEAFDPTLGVTVTTAPAAAPEVVGGLVPTPDTRTEAEVMAARGHMVGLTFVEAESKPTITATKENS